MEVNVISYGVLFGMMALNLFNVLWIGITISKIHKLVEQEANRSQAIRHSSKEIVKALREKAPRNW